MEVNFDLLIPIECSDLKNRLLKMPLFLYQSDEWTDWWSGNLKRPRMVLKHHDFAFSEQAERGILKGVENQFGAIQELKADFRKKVENPHRMRNVDVKIDPLSLVECRLVYRGNNGNFHSETCLYEFQRTIENYTGNSIYGMFEPDSEASQLQFSMSFDFKLSDLLPRNREQREYARNFVRQLRASEVPFYALWSPNCIFSYVVAINHPETQEYVVDFSYVPVTKRALRSAFVK